MYTALPAANTMSEFNIGEPAADGARVAVAATTLAGCDLVYFGVVRQIFGSLWWYPPLSGARSSRAYVVTAILFCAVIFGIVASLFEATTIGEAASVGVLLGILVFGVFNACALVLVDEWTMATAVLDLLYGVGTYAAASAAIWHLV